MYQSQRGFGLMGLLFILALIGAGLGATYVINHNPELVTKISNLVSNNDAALVLTANVYPAKKSDVIDTHKLTLGDNKYGSSAKRGYIYSCQTTFTDRGGAGTDGPWIQGSTWDLTQKISVQGSVSWPQALFKIGTTSTTRTFSGNGLPVGEVTGTYPIQSSDPAYAYDRNPNSIKSQTISFSVPLNPTIATKPSCLGGGMIGVALDGVPIFDGLDAGGRDAVAHELQDACSGHPQQEGMYHYHGPSSCMPHITDNNALVGYALDGFGIYSEYDKNGKELTDADLDACHGTTTQIVWNGVKKTMYHYVMTKEFPYTLGCFKGKATTIPHQNNGQGQGQMQGQGGPQGMMPPPPFGFPPQ